MIAPSPLAAPTAARASTPASGPAGRARGQARDEATLSPAAATAIRAYAVVAIGVTVERAVGIVLVIAAFVLGWRTALLARRDRAGATGSGAMPMSSALTWLLPLPALQLVATTPLNDSDAYEALCRVVAGVLVVVVLATIFAAERGRRIALGVAVLAVGALLVATIRTIPAPRIDVWTGVQTATRALFTGRDPYATPIPDTYGGRVDYGYVIGAFPYPPFTLVFAAPGFLLFGDVRYSLIFAFFGALALVDRALRRRGMAASTRGLFLLALLVFPRLAHIVAMSWVEPFLLLCFATVFWCDGRAPRSPFETFVVGVAALLKQYLVVPTAAYLLLRPRPRAIAIAIVGCAAALVPFFVRHPAETLRWGFVFNTALTTFRKDALSIPAFLYGFTGVALTNRVITGGTQIAAIAVGMALLRDRRGHRPLGIGAYFLITGLAVFAAFLVGWQAFMNYYFMAGALFLLAGAAFDSETRA